MGRGTRRGAAPGIRGRTVIIINVVIVIVIAIIIVIIISNNSIIDACELLDPRVGAAGVRGEPCEHGPWL